MNASVFAPGATFEIKNWIARRLMEEVKQDWFFRNLEVVELLRETDKAIQVRVKGVRGKVANCHICGKRLDAEGSILNGIGPVCIKKYGVREEDFEKVFKVWIPKSQIRSEGEEEEDDEEVKPPREIVLITEIEHRLTELKSLLSTRSPR